MKRLLEKHPDGTEVWFYAPGDGTYQVYVIADIDKQLERNRQLQNDKSYSDKGKKRGMWHYASIPNFVLEQWHNKGLIDLKYPLSPKEDESKLDRIRRRFLERTRQHEKLREIDLRQEMASRNKQAITKLVNDPDWRWLKTVSGRV